MSNRAQRRAEKRAMDRAGVALVARRNLPRDLVPVAYRIAPLVAAALRELEAKGADMTARIAITVGGDHPDFPGETVIEAKASAMREGWQPLGGIGSTSGVTVEVHAPGDCSDPRCVLDHGDPDEGE